MNDRVLIYAGLALFVSLVTYPVWHGVLTNCKTGEPELRRPANGVSCVDSRSYMRASHMELLRQWRDGKVRESRRNYSSSAGTSYVVSLSGTCLTRCHGSAEEFCIRCHAFAGVPPLSCWHCHTSPPKDQPVQAKAAARGA